MKKPDLVPGPPATLAHRNHAVDERRRIQAELAATKRTAAGWGKGIAGLFAAIAALGLVRGRSDIEQLAAPWSVLVGIAFAFALSSGLVAAFFTMRAAHGRPFRQRVRAGHSLGGAPLPFSSDHIEARQSARALLWGLALAVASMVGISTALGVTWYAPRATPPLLQLIDDSGTAWCGAPERLNLGLLTLQTDQGAVVIDLSTATTIQTTVICPAAP
ncbi:hypothetical protein ACQEVI_23750 [Promicromonospora sp. CA-289599]|uniref:hypothetical protein n=1 Tax=Promicromonospora sp. CA-289599 TaxID=3240014 RepID=UPI003D91AE1E